MRIFHDGPQFGIPIEIFCYTEMVAFPLENTALFCFGPMLALTKKFYNSHNKTSVCWDSMCHLLESKSLFTNSADRGSWARAHMHAYWNPCFNPPILWHQSIVHGLTTSLISRYCPDPTYRFCSARYIKPWWLALDFKAVPSGKYNKHTSQRFNVSTSCVIVVHHLESLCEANLECHRAGVSV